MKENGIGLVFRLIGAFWVTYQVAMILQELTVKTPPISFSVVTGMLMGMFFIFLVWISAENVNEKKETNND